MHSQTPEENPLRTVIPSIILDVAIIDGKCGKMKLCAHNGGRRALRNGGSIHWLKWKPKRITSCCLSPHECLSAEIAKRVGFLLLACARPASCPSQTQCKRRATKTIKCTFTWCDTFIAGTFLAQASNFYRQRSRWARIRLGVRLIVVSLRCFCPVPQEKFNLSTASERQREIDFCCCQQWPAGYIF